MEEPIRGPEFEADDLNGSLPVGFLEVDPVPETEAVATVDADLRLPDGLLGGDEAPGNPVLDSTEPAGGLGSRTGASDHWELGLDGPLFPVEEDAPRDETLPPLPWTFPEALFEGPQHHDLFEAESSGVEAAPTELFDAAPSPVEPVFSDEPAAAEPFEAYPFEAEPFEMGEAEPFEAEPFDPFEIVEAEPFEDGTGEPVVQPALDATETPELTAHPFASSVTIEAAGTTAAAYEATAEVNAELNGAEAGPAPVPLAPVEPVASDDVGDPEVSPLGAEEPVELTVDPVQPPDTFEPAGLMEPANDAGAAPALVALAPPAPTAPAPSPRPTARAGRVAVLADHRRMRIVAAGAAAIALVVALMVTLLAPDDTGQVETVLPRPGVSTVAPVLQPPTSALLPATADQPAPLPPDTGGPSPGPDQAGPPSASQPARGAPPAAAPTRSVGTSPAASPAPSARSTPAPAPAAAQPPPPAEAAPEQGPVEAEPPPREEGARDRRADSSASSSPTATSPPSPPPTSPSVGPFLPVPTAPPPTAPPPPPPPTTAPPAPPTTQAPSTPLPTRPCLDGTPPRPVPC